MVVFEQVTQFGIICPHVRHWLDCPIVKYPGEHAVQTELLEQVMQFVMAVEQLMQVLLFR